MADILDPLADNGGATLTHSLPIGSLALNNADVDVCLSSPIDGVDQRGMARLENACDIGAFESSLGANQVAFMVQAGDIEEDSRQNREFTITLDRPQETRFVVDFATLDGSATGDVDYVSRFGSMTFLPGQTVKRRFITINDDDIVEGDESFSFRAAAADDPSNEVIAQATIIDNDVPELPVISIESSSLEVSEGGRAAVVFITLSEPLSFPVQVSFETIPGSAQSGSDFVARMEV